MIRNMLIEIWDRLRAENPHRQDILERIRIQGLRGIRDLTLQFAYPVTVLAGPNACGKSTVLCATACAYAKLENSENKYPKGRAFIPSMFFPDFLNIKEHLFDMRKPSIIEFNYTSGGQKSMMIWHRGQKSEKYPSGRLWMRSYKGMMGAEQPKRNVYLHTIRSLNRPSEIRSVFQATRNLVSSEMPTDTLIFAHRILPFKYNYLRVFDEGNRDFLFAERQDKEIKGETSNEINSNIRYSEFHMSSGERSILRLSRDLSDLTNALVLIDEVETGLHPFTQQELMLELQRLALRQQLQIIVTTHSPVVLECVPHEGRIFLNRTEDNVELSPLQRDVMQKALYGQSVDKLSILCEDEEAENLIRGIMDALNPQMNLIPSDIEIGRNTGKSEFPVHIRAIAKFNQLLEFLFILDGDARKEEDKIRQAAGDKYSWQVKLLFLPGDTNPEAWIWEKLKMHTGEYAESLGLTEESLRRLLEDFERMFDGATDSLSNKQKGRLQVLANELTRDIRDICRLAGKTETHRLLSNRSRDLAFRLFIQDFQDAITQWRQRVER